VEEKGPERGITRRVTRLGRAAGFWAASAKFIKLDGEMEDAEIVNSKGSEDAAREDDGSSKSQTLRLCHKHT